MNQDGSAPAPPTETFPDDASMTDSLHQSEPGPSSSSSPSATPARLQNLDNMAALAASSPAVERGNPFSMHVLARTSISSAVNKGKKRENEADDADGQTILEGTQGNSAASITDGVDGSASPPVLEPAEAVRQQFYAFSKHKRTLNTLIRNNPGLMSGTFSVLIQNPKVLDFDNKRSYFHRRLHKRSPTHAREHYGALQINVRRQHVFEDSYRQLQQRTGDEIKYGKLNIRFYNEEGVDAGGVTREWFQVLARQMFNPDYALFSPCAADRLTYTPNRISWVNPEHLAFFKFVGRVIGKAIYDGRLLDAYFTRSMYKQILGRPVDYRDIESIDPEYYNSLVWMLQNDITDVIDQTFSVEADDLGQFKVVDLIPNGRTIPVTQANKSQYIKLISQQKLTKEIQEQIDAFLTGFYQVVPKELIQIFSDAELELLISGLPDIDVDEWRSHTAYHNLSSTSNSVVWFWRAVRSFDQTDRAKLLQFCTGSSRVPLEGFQALQGVQGNTKFTIVAAHTENILPTAHTCFNQIDLPNYPTYDDLRRLLLLAINEGNEGFGFA